MTQTQKGHHKMSKFQLGHLLQASISDILTANASDDQDLLGVAVSHGPLCDLHQHGEHGLLQEGRCQRRATQKTGSVRRLSN